MGSLLVHTANVSGQPFKSVFPVDVLSRGSILIDEQLPLSCDFLLVDIVAALQCPVRLFGSTSEAFRQMMRQSCTDVDIVSVFDGRDSAKSLLSENSHIPATLAEDTCLVDDMRMRATFGLHSKPRIAVFRAGLATEADYYNYDTIIRVEVPVGGISAATDGAVHAFSRDITHARMCYTVTATETLYSIIDQ